MTHGALAQGTTKVQVRGGQQKSVAGGKVRIKLVSVEDSRCPANFKCRMAGNAKVMAEVSVRGGETRILEFNTYAREGDGAGQIDAYHLKLTSLTPVPRSKQKLRTRDYIATFSVVGPKR